MAYTLNVNLANKANYGAKRSTSKIKYIVVHFTANDGDTAENNGLYFRNNKVYASAHYFVDDDSIVQSVPDNYVAWSVGGSRYSDYKTTGGAKFYNKCTNANSISIELCDTVKDGKYMATEKTLENAVLLIKDLMKKYSVSIDNVIRHFDVNGKKCPSYFVNDTKWNEFKARITKQEEAKVSTSSKVDVTYAVQIKGERILPAVKNDEDYAGIENNKITGIAMKVSKGTIKYRVHVLGGKWLPWVTGYNWDKDSGYAGNGKVIDAIQIVYTSPSSLKNGNLKAKYRVSSTNSKTYYSWQTNNTVNKSKDMDGYAGALGKAMDKVQICIE